jgi:hypothetical protein
MNVERRRELESAIKAQRSLEEIVGLLRRYRDEGTSQAEVYAFLDELHRGATDDAVDDRVLEVADFVAGFCAPHLKIWDQELPSR